MSELDNRRCRRTVRCDWEDGVKLGQRILAVLVRLGLPRNKRSMPWLDQLVKQGQVFCACGDPDMVAPEELSWADLVRRRDIDLVRRDRS